MIACIFIQWAFIEHYRPGTELDPGDTKARSATCKELKGNGVHY